MERFIGLDVPTFRLIRPSGHHASADSSWGFCIFNNMAIALLHLHHHGCIRTALVLDIDLHYGDGTANILGRLIRMVLPPGPKIHPAWRCRSSVTYHKE